MEQNKIGLVKIIKGTPDGARHSLECFFIEKGLFIASIPEGIVVNDTEKAQEEVNIAKKMHKYDRK